MEIDSIVKVAENASLIKADELEYWKYGIDLDYDNIKVWRLQNEYLILVGPKGSFLDAGFVVAIDADSHEVIDIFN